MTRAPATESYIPAVGKEWIYRRREHAPSERVRIVAVHEGKRSTRVDIEFCDGDRAGTSENVPASRLHGPWDIVAEHDERMANWQRLSEFELTEPEQTAVEKVFQLLIPDETADWIWNPVRFATAVHDPAALEKVTSVPAAGLAEHVASFQNNEVTMLSAEGTLLVAEHACRNNPMPVLDAVVEEEKELRERCKRGGQIQSSSGRVDISTSPEWEYDWYRKHHRPVHELLRQWCGYRAITLQERLAAAEAENHRLDGLANRLIASPTKATSTSPAPWSKNSKASASLPKRSDPSSTNPFTPPRSPFTTNTGHVAGADGLRTTPVITRGTRSD